MNISSSSTPSLSSIQDTRRSLLNSTIWKASSGRFVYTPLDPSCQQIRLFKVTLNVQGELEGHLKHFRLEEVSQFTESKHGNNASIVFRPLSYTWGPSAPCFEITVDGKAFFVRHNLYNFLHILVQECQDEYFWIDQICINQEDLPERNKLVNVMSDVYKDANVFVWLDGLGPSTENAFDEIETWAERPWKCLSGTMLDLLP
ncbi:uncharacterized protein PV09_04859 [Verruconis gallopava]|uniref:Heterokaryon incompatibility domain-containing protein n=1 Tax=Verruconis gallopava TaxID=253628 RepID=A0A0D1YTS9_9PEZI|nr:uncharacterized protein PV09_04859 [Verruconis gallopava]KIW04037.1 hypothetical protein PV09_04859 [Verruconis gallopava]